MELDIPGFLVADAVVSFHLTPLVLLIATGVRGLLLFSGKKREFEGWIRNTALTLVSVLLLPGLIVHMAVRYVLAKVMGLEVEQVRTSTTYGEVNLYFTVDRPPEVGIVLTYMFLTVFLSVYMALAMAALPVALAAPTVWVLACQYLCVCVLVNSAVRSGDVSLLAAAFRQRPVLGVVEAVCVCISLYVAYCLALGVPAS